MLSQSVQGPVSEGLDQAHDATGCGLPGYPSAVYYSLSQHNTSPCNHQLASEWLLARSCSIADRRTQKLPGQLHTFRVVGVVPTKGTPLVRASQTTGLNRCQTDAKELLGFAVALLGTLAY